MSGPSAAVAAVLVYFFSLSADPAECQRYIVPEATLEFQSPRGLKISIPDIDTSVTLVAFHININEEFVGLEHGHWAQDLLKKRDGRWSYYIPDFKVKQGDTVYYWIYVVVDRLAYHGLDRTYKVNESNPHRTTAAMPPPTAVLPTDTSPHRHSEQPTACVPSLTRHNGGVSSCQGQVLLDKHFHSLDGWSHEVQIGGSQLDDEFTVFTKESATSRIEDNNLVIKPVLLEEKYNDTFVRTGCLTLKGCTSSVPDQCSRQGVSFLILPPILSARINTKNTFTFSYGVVQIRAKLPRGDWIVPELWLVPKASQGVEHSGRVVIALSRGNTDLNATDSNWLLEAGLVADHSSQLAKKTSERKWSRDYHNFKLTWTEDEMVFSVDNEEFSRLKTEQWKRSLKSRNSAVFDQEFYITLGVHVAGGKDFSDSLKNKPWKNTNPKRFVQFWESKNVWHPSWNEDSALCVESVKVTAL